MRKFRNNEEAFTGLEAAIVLIAFVVVAAVFSYVVLGAGFFTTQKSQEVIHAGVQSAASNIIVKGDVYGIADSQTSAASIQYIQFDVGLAAGGLPIDMGRTNMIFSTTGIAPYSLTKSTSSTTNPEATYWIIYEKSPTSADDVLDIGETFTIRMRPTAAMGPRTVFNLEIKPEYGAALAISRSVPPSITYNTLLY
ncbi:MAG: archaellin/type IV pilin N-terminal domain-containing protein [Methanoregulaceae archaeon]|jgi:flagellin FlaB